MLSAAVKKVTQTGIDLGIPEPVRTSQWAEMYRNVERGARKGRWSNDVTPYLVEIMDCDDDPAVREVVFMKSRQLGGSETVLNVIGKRIHLAPTEIIYCAEKEDKAKAWTQESFDSTLRTTPALKNLVFNTPEDNNQKVKRFPGGGLYIIWASSPAEASSRPAELVIFDEKAKYKPTPEGDVVMIAEGSQNTYAESAKTFKISTPQNADDPSDIGHDYERGDKREFYVPCPACDEPQVLKFGQPGATFGLKWDDGDPETTYYLCEHNGCMILWDDLPDMLLKGQWHASAPFNGVASFKLSQLYSPFVPWSHMSRDFLKAKKFRSTLQAWTNVQLGEPWREEEQIDYATIKLNREPYPLPWPNEDANGNFDLVAPLGVLVVTAGIDVQGDRLEAELVGWGRDHESWSIDYRVIFGDPGGIEIWEALSDYLMSEIPGFKIVGDDAEPVATTFRVSAAGIDTGGHHTQQVYRFCKTNAAKRWFALKGSSQPGNPLIAKPRWVGQNPKVRLFSIGTDTAKDEVFSFLQVPTPGPGFCHFPEDRRYDDAYIKQLCSEKKKPRFQMGRQYFIYEKVSANARNEALDVRVYATAARAILNPNYDAIAKRRLQHVEAADAAVVESGQLIVDSEEPAKRGTTVSGPSNVVPIRRGGSLTKNNPFGDYRP